uniref:SCP domain-containing protein n=1 Tax=Strongyloides venezuelensis TaxID=75913 RepID=A0A0K0FJ90_STRVS
MIIFCSNYFIIFIILSTLFFQYHALDNEKESSNEPEPLIQNDEDSGYIVKRDTIIDPIAEVREHEYLEKRAAKKSTSSKKPKKKTNKKPSKKPKKKKPSKYEKMKKKLKSTINTIRKKYQAKKLTHDKRLASIAQNFVDKYAEKNVKESKYKLEKNESVGALIYRNKFNQAYVPFSLWTLGAPFIDFKNPERFPAGGDFTQLIWRSTKKIGCGISYKAKTKEVITLCLLSPKGNIEGKFKENIREPKD